MIDVDDAIALLAAVLIRAFRDVAAGDAEAREWITGGGCDGWLESFGLDLKVVDLFRKNRTGRA